VGHALDGLGQRVQVDDVLLHQVTDAGGAVAKKADRLVRLNVL
jgi:hypothetical protein